MKSRIKEIPTQRRVLKGCKGMLNDSPAQGNLWRLDTKYIHKKKFQKIQEIQNLSRILATSFQYMTRLCASHGESFPDRKRDRLSGTDR